MCMLHGTDPLHKAEADVLSSPDREIGWCHRVLDPTSFFLLVSSRPTPLIVWGTADGETLCLA